MGRHRKGGGLGSDLRTVIVIALAVMIVATLVGLWWASGVRT